MKSIVLRSVWYKFFFNILVFENKKRGGERRGSCFENG